MFKKFFFIIALFLLAPANLLATDLYSWTDDNGVTHYASKAKAPKHAEPTSLPKINRGDVKLTESKLISCGDRGGINCQAGADEDGSVICYDGFKDASPLYGISCASPKLKITKVSEPDFQGHFSVTIRNSKSVEAKEVQVTYKPEELESEIVLVGPEHVEPFGVAEFSYAPKEIDLRSSSVSLAKLEIKCANCG